MGPKSCNDLLITLSAEGICTNIQAMAQPYTPEHAFLFLKSPLSCLILVIINHMIIYRSPIYCYTIMALTLIIALLQCSLCNLIAVFPSLLRLMVDSKVLLGSENSCCVVESMIHS